MPFTTVVASDAFDGADTADIAARVPDGNGTPALEEGVWAKNDATDYSGAATELIGIAANDGVKTGADPFGVVYPLTGISAIGNDYRATAVLRAPDLVDPGSPGTDPYVEPWRYEVSNGSGLVYEDGLVSDLGTGTSFVYGTTPGTFELADLDLWSNGQPKTWAFEFSGGDPGTGAGRLYLRFYTRVHKTAGGVHTYDATVTWTQARDPDVSANPFPPPDFIYSNYGARFRAGGVASTPLAIALGPQNVEPAHPYPPFYYPDGQPATVTVTVSSSTAAPILELIMEGEPVSDSAGRITVDEWEEMLFDGTDTYDVGTPGSDASLPFFIGPCVRYDTVTDTGYQLNRTRSVVELWAADAGAFALLRTISDAVALDTDESWSLEAEGTVLRVYKDDVEVPGLGVDTATDLDDDSNPIVPHAAGSPAAIIMDAGGLGAQVKLRRFDVCAGACVRPPGVPDPRDPPPREPSDVVRIKVKKRGLWHPVTGPGPTVDEPHVTTKRSGLFRLPKSLKVKVRGRWKVVQTVQVDQFPPGGPVFPPRLDLCEELNPDDDLPPIGDVDPIPFAGGRFFGMDDLATTLIGALFNATKSGMSNYTLNMVAQCEARGGSFLSGQGRYKNFWTGNYYDPDRYDAQIQAWGTAMGATLLTKQTAGSYIGHSIADDFKVQALWPTSIATGGGTGSGVSDAELERLCTVYGVWMPGIRLGIRQRPSRFTGGPINGLSFYIAQYDGAQQVGKTASRTASSGTRVTATDFRDWRDAECGDVASFANGSQVILSLNYLHGGDGRSGQIWTDGTLWSGRFMMSAEEVIAAADGFFGDGGGGYAPYIMGSFGYEYFPEQLDGSLVPGMLDAMTYFRNGLMSLAPL